MNAWVKEQTAGRIADLVSAASIKPGTKLVLIAALCFKASWLEPFSRSKTGDAPFTRRDGSRIEVPMMNLDARLGHAVAASAEVVELQFRSPLHSTTEGRQSAEAAPSEEEGPRFSMLLALPKSRLKEVPFDEIARVLDGPARGLESRSDSGGASLQDRVQVLSDGSACRDGHAGHVERRGRLLENHRLRGALAG